MNVYRVFEIILFALFNFMPYVLLSVYTFYDRMRFSKRVTYIACFLLVIIQFMTRFWTVLNHWDFSLGLSLFRLIIFLAVYAALFDIRFGKILFIELIFANIGNCIIIAAICLERNLFPNIDHRLYCWHTSLVMCLLHLILTIPFAWSIKRYFKPMITNKIVGNLWDYYWVVPAIFYVIWQYILHGGSETGLEIIVNPSNVIFLFIIQISSYLIYYLMLSLDGQLILNMDLERKKHLADLETLEYKLMEERIEDARRARHDVRHHMIVMADYLDCEDYDGLKNYLKNYRESLPDASVISFCPHHTINSVLLYFAHQARELQIDFQAQISVPEHLSVADTDISILLGNLLENAIDACKESSGEKKIIILGKADAHTLFFTIDNTCTHIVKRNIKGHFLSTKRKGSGIGIESVKNIVKRYDGVFTAEKKDEMFYVSFMLNI